MSRLYTCPNCATAQDQSTQFTNLVPHYCCVSCKASTPCSEWNIVLERIETPKTPETLNKEDALRIMEAYFKAGFNNADKGCILYSAIKHLESLKYLGDSGE